MVSAIKQLLIIWFYYSINKTVKSTVKDHIKPYPFSALIHFEAKKCGGAGHGGGGVRPRDRRTGSVDCPRFNHSVAYRYWVGGGWCAFLVNIKGNIIGGTGGFSIGGGGGTPKIIFNRLKNKILFILLFYIIDYWIDQIREVKMHLNLGLLFKDT